MTTSSNLNPEPLRELAKRLDAGLRDIHQRIDSVNRRIDWLIGAGRLLVSILLQGSFAKLYSAEFTEPYSHPDAQSQQYPSRQREGENSRIRCCIFC